MKNRLKKFIPVICLIPFLAGAAGYQIAGERFTDSLYSSFALYFTNPVSDAYNGYIEFSRWTAPLVTATAILCILKNVWNNLFWRLSLLCQEDSAAVYSDEAIRIQFDQGTKAIYPGDEFKPYAKEHLILFSSDERSLAFYEAHKSQFEKKPVYIGLKDLELGLVREVRGVTLFDINGSIARLLWKNIALWKSDQKAWNIVIYGSNPLAQEIMSAGLQLNLFSLKQSIKYHYISENLFFQIKHPHMPLMNEDEITYYETRDPGIWEVISHADRIIVAEQIPLDVLQTIVVKANNKIVYYYSPEEGDGGDYIAFKTLIPFGRKTELFTDENIRRQRLIRNAVERNRQYAEAYHSEKDWNHLSGFLQLSNISSADFGEVLLSLPSDVSDEELAELEHIRWCRFHYLHYWQYGVPEHEKSKDEERRIHKDLVPYHQLKYEEKEKDMATVRAFRKKA